MKFIVVHSGARDLYKLSVALYKNNRLGYLVTDDFFLRKEYRKVLPAKLVKISYMGFVIRVFCQIFKKWRSLHIYKDFFLGRTAGKLSKRKKMPLCSYSEYAYHAYKYSDIRPRVLFQFHPHACSNRKIFFDEIKRHPETASNLMKEKECMISEKKLNQSLSEIRQTDVFLVASSFTKQTLVENGMDPNKIFIAPYGVDLTEYPFKEKKVKEKITFAFVGNYTQRKGIYYLLSAAKKLQDEGYDFNVKMTGRSKLDVEELAKYGVKNLSTYFMLSHKELIQMLHSSDVFVFPSLCEGFAFVIIEAMSTGLPVIATTRTAGRDIVKEGEDGFTIAPSSVDALVEKMRYFLDNPAECVRMGRNANQTSKGITWDNFEKKVMKGILYAENMEL